MIRDSALDALLTSDLPIPQKTLILVAHPDDEVLGLSLLLPRLSDGLLVHATDGATPGMPDPAALSSKRFSEVDEALKVLGAGSLARARLDLPDGVLIEHAAAAIKGVVPLLRGVELAVTHCFEGGHPDHDACALILKLACLQLAGTGYPEPNRVEFPLYARQGSGIRFNAFWPDEEQDRTFRLKLHQQRSKRRALQTFHSQREVVGHFPIAVEAFRPAPEYDFLSTRRSEELLYSGQAHRWQAAASRVLIGTCSENGALIRISERLSE